MRIFLTIAFFINSIIQYGPKDINSNKLFIGEIYYETFKTHSVSYNVIENSLGKIDHPLLKDKIDKYQIENETLINNSYDFEQNKIKDLSNIQIGHVLSIYTIAAPDIRDKSKLEELLMQKPQYLSRKDNSKQKELKATKSKKNILGFSCKKYVYNSYNKYTKQEFITEYWIQEDMKYDQYKYGNMFGKIFSDKGIILEKLALLKPSMDTFSHSYAIRIDFVDNFDIDLDKLGL